MPDRKLTVWEWSSGAHTPKIEVEVRMKWTDNMAGGSAKFYVDVSSPLQIKAEATDLEVLRAKVDAELDGFYELEWESWLAVKFESRHREPLDVGLNIEIDEWQQSTRESDGQVFHRHFDRRRGSTKMGSVRRGAVTERMPQYSNDTKLIRDTPENRAALATITEGVKLLGQRLTAFLAQDDIEAALADVASSGIMKLAAPQA